MLTFYFEGHAFGLNNIACVWATRPQWWEYEGTNFVERGSNMLKYSDFTIDTPETREQFGLDEFAHKPFVQVTAPGVYQIESIRMVDVKFNIRESFNTFKVCPYDPDTTGKDRSSTTEGSVMCAFLSGGTKERIPFIVLGLFVGMNAIYDSLEKFHKEVVMTAVNGCIKQEDYDAWVEHNSGSRHPLALDLLKRRHCPIDEETDFYTGPYYAGTGPSIKSYPANYIEVEPGKYRFKGSEEDLIRDEDGVAITITEAKRREEAARNETVKAKQEDGFGIILPDPDFEKMLERANLR